MIHEISSSLDPCVGQLANLLAVKAIPSPSVELVIELLNGAGVDEVDKGIAHIAGVVMVDGQVEEVNLHFMVPADFFKEHFF
jgi:hypothetical protein